MHEVLVNRLGGLSLPRKSVVRLTDRPDMTLDVYRGRKTTKTTGGVNMPNLHNILISKQIKSLYQIIVSEEAHWNMIGKEWLKRFDSEFNENFLYVNALTRKV